MTGGENIDATVSGFTITGATAGGVRVLACPYLVIENCVIRNNANEDPMLPGGAASSSTEGGASIIRNCVIASNDAAYGGWR